MLRHCFKEVQWFIQLTNLQQYCSFKLLLVRCYFVNQLSVATATNGKGMVTIFIAIIIASNQINYFKFLNIALNHRNLLLYCPSHLLHFDFTLFHPLNFNLLRLIHLLLWYHHQLGNTKVNHLLLFTFNIIFSCALCIGWKELISYLTAFITDSNCCKEPTKPIVMPASCYFIVKYSLFDAY